MAVPKRKHKVRLTPQRLIYIQLKALFKYKLAYEIQKPQLTGDFKSDTKIDTDTTIESSEVREMPKINIKPISAYQPARFIFTDKKWNLRYLWEKYHHQGIRNLTRKILL